MSNKYAVVTGTPVARVRHYENRNQNKLAKRVARWENQHGALYRVVTESGTLKLYAPYQVVETGTVRRDMQRRAKKLGAEFATL